MSDFDDVKESWKLEQGKLVVCRTQDVEPYLEANKRARDNFKVQRGSRLRKVAEVPNVVAEQWMRMGVNIFDRNDAKKVQALLNSNEYAYLRTSPGKCKVQ